MGSGLFVGVLEIRFVCALSYMYITVAITDIQKVKFYTSPCQESSLPTNDEDCWELSRSLKCIYIVNARRATDAGFP
jgi:hypothetical protein